MQTEWDPDELIDTWTLVDSDWELVGNKSGTTCLGFVLPLKFYEIEGRFPAYPEEVPPAAVDYVASPVKVDSVLFVKYSWRDRAIKYYRSQIRQAFGTRSASEEDEGRWARCSGEGRRARPIPGRVKQQDPCRGR